MAQNGYVDFMDERNERINHGSINLICEFPFLASNHADENEISGSIPLGIGYLTALRTVVLGNNMLTGTLPRVITGLTKLHQLDLRK